MRSSDMGWIRINLDFSILWAFPESLFRAGGVLASFQAFINVYKHYGSIAVDLDPRSKITEKTSWIQGLDPRSKIPGKTSWIQDPRLQKKLLGSKVWIQDPRSKITEKTSWIQDLRLQKKLLGSKVRIQDPRLQEKLLGSEDKAFPDPRLGSAVDPKNGYLIYTISEEGSR